MTELLKQMKAILGNPMVLTNIKTTSSTSFSK
jgi:hypothetical protein